MDAETMVSGIAVGAESPVDGGALPPAIIGGSGAGTLLAAMHGGTVGGVSVPAPFSAPICLVEGTRVAGTSHVSGIRALAADLSVGDELRLERDPNNRFDRWAIRVLDVRGNRLGFVPADKNEVLARLMDGGKRVFARLTGVEQRDAWTRIGMDVYLDD